MKKTQVILTSLLLCFCLISFGQNANKSVKKTTTATNVAGKMDNTLTPQEKKAGFVLLFDGKSTDQWHGYNLKTFPKKGWEAKDGVLHCIGSGNGEAGGGGDIVTNEKYKDFELKLDWKISEGGNSGVFILAVEKPNQPIYYSAPEMQLLDNDRHPDAKLGKNGNRKAGSLYDLIPAVPQNTKPAGLWNSITITCYQGSVIYHQNGANVVEYHLWTDAWKKMVKNSKFKDWDDFVNIAHEGLIGLQDHGGDIWFKNIKIKKM